MRAISRRSSTLQPRRMSRRVPLVARSVLCAVLLLPCRLPAQALKPAPSGRATTTLALNPSREAAQAGAKPAIISIDYGQPNARGRAVAGALEGDLDKVWRLGANEATEISTDVDLVIGTLTVPKGKYTLAAQTSRAGEWKLIVNRKTGQWGIPYDASTELGRTPLRSRTLPASIESLTIWLIPAADGSAAGELRFAWGTREFSAAWRVK